MKYIVVGGVAGGASFACRLRRLSEDAEIVLYEKSHYVSYANCGLPYYVSSVIADRESLTLQTPESLKARFNLEVHVDHEVLSIDPKTHTVLVENRRTKERFRDSYDRLVLSPGAEAIRLTENGERVFELKTVEDSLRLRQFVEERRPQEALVIGGGFIGLEIAENLVEAGVKVTVVEGKDHVLANLDPEMASFVHQELLRHGVVLKRRTKVLSIRNEGEKVLVETDRGLLRADFLVQAVGVRPASRLAREAGLYLDIRGTIKTDSRFRTSDSDIYAIGDAISLDSGIDGDRVHIALAGLANKEGRFLADSLCLDRNPSLCPFGTSILKVFSLAAASTGRSEEQLKEKRIPYGKVYLSPFHHASYYPGSSPLTLKVLYALEDGRLLGAQVVGREGVDKRIDVLATALFLRARIWDLARLELSYAPPFSSAKDPVNLAGYVAENVQDGLVSQFFFDEVDSLSAREDVLFVDVRTRQEYLHGHVKGSINVPVGELRLRLEELPREKELLLICESALRSYVAARFLGQKGYRVRHLAGGYRLYSTWKEDQRILFEETNPSVR